MTIHVGTSVLPDSVALVTSANQFANGDQTNTQAGKGWAVTTPDGTKQYRLRVDNFGVVISELIWNGSAYDTAVLADSPIAYYPMNEASGATIADRSGNGLDASITGSLTLGATGIGDGETAISGFNFSAPNYIQLPSGLVIPGSHAITVEFFVNGGSAENSAFQLGSSPNYGQCHSPFDGTIYWDYGGASGNSRISHALATPAAWTLIHLVADTNFMAIYVNASLLVSAAAWTPPTSSVVGGTIGYSAAGLRAEGGALAKFAVYDRKLTTAQMSNHLAAV